MKMLRIAEVMELTGMGKSSIWDKSKNGTFPSPVKLGPRITAWVAEEIDAWIAEKVAANRD
jgi:prophage regulatory protein